MKIIEARSDEQANELVNRPVMLMTEDAAQYLGLAKATLNKWRCHGGGPIFVKLGRAVRYRREDLDRFLEARSLSSTSQSPRG